MENVYKNLAEKTVFSIAISVTGFCIGSTCIAASIYLLNGGFQWN